MFQLALGFLLDLHVIGAAAIVTEMIPPLARFSLETFPQLLSKLKIQVGSFVMSSNIMRSSGKTALRPEEYTIACICPLAIESAPLEALLDRTHLQTFWTGYNSYTLGEIGPHNVVVATMPETGNYKVASVAANLMNDFKSIKFGLLIGIGGGLPSEDVDIRLGDIVIGLPENNDCAVVQFDRGKSYPGGQFERTGFLNNPPRVLLRAIQQLRARHGHESSAISVILEQMIKKFPLMMDNGYTYPGRARDVLFRPEYAHEPGPTCARCDESYIVKRDSRPDRHPRIHYGIIGSSNMVIKDGMLREELKQQLRLQCVDMEAAGVADLQFLTIRGISDYADSHKNKEWQPYAAAVAAAYAKDLLSMLPPAPQQIESVPQALSLLATHEGKGSPKIEMKAEKIFHKSTFSSSGPMYF